MIISINDRNSLQNATEVFRTGGVLVFPTDTVYGIGCILNKTAIRKLYKIKRRKNQPTAILMTKDLFIALYRSSSNVGKLPEEFWAGKMTIIFPVNKFEVIFSAMIIKDETIGIRLPDHRWLKELINEVGPIVTSSANRAGEQTPVKFSELDKGVIDEADLTIQTSQTLSGKPSMIYDLINDKMIRP